MPNFRDFVLTFAVLFLLPTCDIQQPQPSPTAPRVQTVQAVTVTPTRPQNGTVVATAAGGNQLIRGHITASNGQTFEYVMLLPESWVSEVAVREQGTAVFVEYRGKPDQPQKILSFAAQTEAEWRAAQTLPHGIALIRSNGVVFAYDIAKANPFTDPQDKAFADEFQQLADQIHTVLETLSIRPAP